MRSESRPFRAGVEIRYGRKLGGSAEYTHEGDLVRETQPVVAAPEDRR